MDAGKKEECFQNPRANANIFEILTYSWTLNLFKTGRKRDLEENDLYIALDASSSLGNDLEKRWKNELANAKRADREPSLLKVLFRMTGVKFMFLGLIQMFVELVLRTSQPILIGGLLTYFDQDESDGVDMRRAYIYASGLVFNMLCNILLFHYSQIEMLHCGMKTRVACCSLIFRKSLRLSRTSLDETTVGQVVNLLSNDVSRFDMAYKHFHFLWIGPLGTVVVTYFLWQEIGGVSSLLGVAGLLAFVPLQVWLGKKTSEFRLKIAPRTDDRVRLMNEIISGIQVIKMYTWERPFAYLVRHARKTEIRQIRGALYIRIIIESFKIFHTRFAVFLSILSYVLLGNYVNAKNVYVIISFYNILMTTMTVYFPRGISMVAEMLTSVKRIQNFLLCGEKDDERTKSSLKFKNGTADDGVLLQPTEITANRGGNDVTVATYGNGNDTERLLLSSVNDGGTTVSNVTAKWTDGVQIENVLENIDVTVKPGQLVAIIGPVGAGKSSLIQAILRELPVSDGNISVRGTVSYASQEPWLFNSSVQQNILFGSPMDHKRYKLVIEACALKTDLERFPHGDRTIVGERGVSLSGGQRARINLARAVYKKADIYLLDDPLSAVDTRVGKHLFHKCIKGFLKGKTCVLITHQIQYLTNMEKIFIMENANITAEGSYRELLSSGLDFTKLFRSSEETPVTSDNESTNKNGVVARQSSVRSVSLSSSSSADESRLDGTRTEPTEVTETRTSGNVRNSVYLSYVTAGGNVGKIFFLIFTCFGTQILCTGGDWWINYWVNLEDSTFRHLNATDNGMSTNDESLSLLWWWPISRQTCVAVYSIVNVTLIVTMFVRCAVFVSFFTSASTKLHDNMFDAITRAKMYFFNTNSSGRILNRFTKDMGAIDEILPIPVLDLLYITLLSTGVLLVIGAINVYFLVPTAIAAVLSYRITTVYLSTSRSVKRLEGVTRSPVLAHVNASLQGLTTIRAFRAEEVLSKEFDKHQDLHSSAWYLFISSSEAFGFALDIVCLVYISVLTFSFLIVGNNDTFGGNVGLVITQAIGLTGSLQWGIRQAAELENNMTSVERVLEYTDVPREAALESPPDKKPPKEWPDKGEIVFENFYLRYSPDTRDVLKNLNIRIRPTEKIGIVGRTGAGKSSLISALFRLAFDDGRIFIDGVEIHELGLHELRSKISIIPQEPVLFSGTMRTNLDPFDEYPDHDLWNALDEVELKTVVEDLPNGLNAKMSAGGTNFSVGQRQLVCLARAILRSNRLIVLDEATANVDSQTDALIQNTIRNKFQPCTVLTIAHRLDTVMDSDKVLVMDAGTAVEFDHPYNLLQNKNGFLYDMVENAERGAADSLREVVAANYCRRTHGEESIRSD